MSTKNKLTPAPHARAKMLSHFIKELELMLESEGDMEVFIANEEEVCFDGVGGMFLLQNVKKGEKQLALMRSDVVVKI